MSDTDNVYPKLSDEALRLECLRMAHEKYSGDQAIKMAEMMYEYIKAGKK